MQNYGDAFSKSISIYDFGYYHQYTNASNKYPAKLEVHFLAWANVCIIPLSKIVRVHKS